MTPSLPRPDVFSFEERQNSALIRSAKLGQLLAAFPITGQSFGAYTWLLAPVLTTTPRPGAFCGKPSRQKSSRSDIPRLTKAGRCLATSHSAFDNDPDTILAILERIKPPAK